MVDTHYIETHLKQKNNVPEAKIAKVVHIYHKGKTYQMVDYLDPTKPAFRQKNHKPQ